MHSRPTALQVNDRALSTRERDRSRFPHREPIGLHRRPRVGRTRLQTEGNDQAASLCLKPTDYARSPRTSRADPRVGVLAEHPSSPERAAEQTPGGSEVESMRCYREIALDTCPTQSVRRCNRGQNDRHAGLHEFRTVFDQAFEPCQFVIELRTGLRISVRQVDGSDQHSI